MEGQESNQEAIRQREASCHVEAIVAAASAAGLRGSRCARTGAGLLAGTAILAAAPASAIPIPPSTSSCTYNGSPVAFAASNTTGTPVTVNCTGLPANTLLIVAQTSPLAGVISPSSAATSEADLSTGTAVTTSASGTLSVTITVTATGGSPGFSALDKKAVCPPTQAQVNAGLTNCVVTVADLATTTGLNFGNIIYPTQPTPHRPTLVLTPSQHRQGRGDADRQRQGRRLPDAGQGQEQVLVGGGPHRGSQPGRRCPRLHHAHTQLASQQHPGGQLAVYCFKGATAAACGGLPVGTLIGPHLSGTITLPRLGPVDRQEVVALEPNTTPDPGNGPSNTVRAVTFVCVSALTAANTC